MRQKKYRLEVVLEVREQKKDEAARFVAYRREQLAESEKELMRRQSFLEDCRKQKSEANRKMMNDFGDGTSAGNIVSHRNYLQILKEREEELKLAVDEQIINVQNAVLAVDDAISKLADASKEVRVIEKHKEKWKKDQKYETDKREQKLSDEIGAILHQRSKKL